MSEPTATPRQLQPQGWGPEPSHSPTVTIPAPFRGLIDDAAIFPPGSSPIREAVAAYVRRSNDSWHSLVGSFVVSDHLLADLKPLLVDAADSPVPLAVVISSGAGGIAPAASQVAHLTGARLAGIELALRDPADLAANARRVVTALDQARDLSLIDDEIGVWVEFPPTLPSAGWLSAADELASAEIGLKFRTGGLESDTFPAPKILASWIEAALDRELPFKCTAGLHHAVRAVDPQTGFTHHGFLNVLCATRACLDGSSAEAVAGVLAESDSSKLLSDLPDADTLTRTRRWFTSFGSCSVTKPLDDLHALGLLED